jgi:hypothetical protein
MQITPPGMRVCPTRVDGEEALFAHVISTSTCQERQRGHFHKCPACSHRNGAETLASTDLIPRPELPELVRGAGALAALPRAAQGA